MSNTRVQWHDDPHTILVLSFSGHWTTRDYMTASETAIRMLNERDGGTHLILNLQQANAAPPGIITAASRMAAHLPASVASLILAGPHRTCQTIISVIRQANPETVLTQIDIHFVATLADAYALLAAD